MADTIGGEPHEPARRANPPPNAPHIGSAHWPRHPCTVILPQTLRSELGTGCLLGSGRLFDPVSGYLKETTEKPKSTSFRSDIRSVITREWLFCCTCAPQWSTKRNIRVLVGRHIIIAHIHIAVLPMYELHTLQNAPRHIIT